MINASRNHLTSAPPKPKPPKPMVGYGELKNDPACTSFRRYDPQVVGILIAL